MWGGRPIPIPPLQILLTFNSSLSIWVFRSAAPLLINVFTAALTPVTRCAAITTAPENPVPSVIFFIKIQSSSTAHFLKRRFAILGSVLFDWAKYNDGWDHLGVNLATARGAFAMLWMTEFRLAEISAVSVDLSFFPGGFDPP